MLDHFIITVSNVDKSKEFYSKVLSAINHEIKLDFGTSVSFGDIDFSGGDPGGYFWIKEGKPSDIHFAFSANSKDEVDNFFKTAIELGGKSNGDPGYREFEEGYYAAFVHDLDGYNIEAVYHEK